MANKVKFNLCDVYYALLEKNTETTAEYATPVRLPGAVSLSLDPEGEQEPFFADGVEYYILSNNMGYTGDLELALIPESFRTDVLKETNDNNQVLIERDDVEFARFALLFRFDGDKKQIRHVIYNCTVYRPKIESKTNEESKEVQTETLNITARPLRMGLVKAKTGNGTAPNTYDNWFKSVYVSGKSTTQKTGG